MVLEHPMPGQKFQLHDGESGAALAIRVQPRAKKNEISGILSDGTIKVRLTAPPVEGKANLALIDFLSAALQVPKSKIEILAGHSGRNKLVSILGLDAETVQERLIANINS